MKYQKIRKFFKPGSPLSESEYRNIPQTYTRELDKQCSKLSVFAIILSLFIWIPYIHLDKVLHPQETLLIYLRLGLTLTAIIALIFRFVLKIRHRNTVSLFLIIAYLQIATGILTALTKAAPVYVSGYILIIMISVVASFQLHKMWIIFTISLIGFFSVLFIMDIKVFTVEMKYSLRDLVISIFLAYVLTYLTDRIRHKNYIKSRVIEKERDQLQYKSNIIKSQMDIASSIQRNLIPSESPAKYIHALYLPMESVGGDFYDFIKFPESDSIGIFICDVSGHGVPAALITSMIKSFILQSGKNINNPAKLMMYLNDLLVNNTNSNFITAFYGIYDPVKKTLFYSNAGHNRPFIFKENDIEVLEYSYSGVPLAIFCNDELIKKEKIYKNRKITIVNEKRLVFYTDGLIDGFQKIDNKSYDKRKSILEIMNVIKTLPPEKFIKTLIDRIIQLKGSRDFEDDVSIITIDFV